MTYDLQSVEKTLKNAPNCHLSVNIKKYKIDYVKMYAEHPILLDMFVRCMDGEDDESHVKMWGNFQQAYHELQADGFFKESFEKEYQAVINEFKAKVDGPNLIPVKSLKDILTKKTRKGVVSYQFEYNEFSALIDDFYGIESRGFFSPYVRDRKEKLYHKYLKISDAEYEKAQRTSPIESVNAAKIRLMSDIFGDDCYVDFWHHMLDAEFESISNGSVATMYVDEEDSQETDDESDQIFSLIRKVFFKEVTSLPAFKDGVEEIEFSISW